MKNFLRSLNESSQELSCVTKGKGGVLLKDKKYWIPARGPE